jgi:cold shock CspA family protein
MLQATVESWDAAEGAVVCLDDGTRVTCSPESVTQGGWRLLRSGQRVALVVEGDPRSDGVVRSVEMLCGP